MRGKLFDRRKDGGFQTISRLLLNYYNYNQYLSLYRLYFCTTYADPEDTAFALRVFFKNFLTSYRKDSVYLSILYFKTLGKQRLIAEVYGVYREVNREKNKRKNQQVTRGSPIVSCGEK